MAAQQDYYQTLGVAGNRRLVVQWETAHFGGDTTTYRGSTVRVVLSAPAVIYHALSVTRDFKDAGFKATLGVANLTDKQPPQVTTLNLGELDTQGNSAFYSQYDWLGRRFFLNLKKTF